MNSPCNKICFKKLFLSYSISDYLFLPIIGNGQITRGKMSIDPKTFHILKISGFATKAQRSTVVFNCVKMIRKKIFSKNKTKFVCFSIPVSVSCESEAVLFYFEYLQLKLKAKVQLSSFFNFEVWKISVEYQQNIFLHFICELISHCKSGFF